MSIPSTPTPSGRATVDLNEVREWKEPPEVSFDQAASLQIARWVLIIFGGVYTLSFILGFAGLWLEGATFEKAFELVQFMITSILPLVTLAVGYYLGDKGRSNSQ